MDYNQIKNYIDTFYDNAVEKIREFFTVRSGLELIAASGYNNPKIDSKRDLFFESPKDKITDYAFFSKRNKSVTDYKVKEKLITVKIGSKTVTLNSHNVKYNSIDYVRKKLGGVKDKTVLKEIARKLEKLRGI
ncbi:hypothetical protein ISS05_00155 [Candidatus Woesearchaeota archaeon]|nr:hypothetical protein [Candidatus Woesearchaeota archaeon]